MRTSICIIVGAQLIAASNLMVERYEFGDIEVSNTDKYIFFGLDQWTGERFMRTAATE